MKTPCAATLSPTRASATTWHPAMNRRVAHRIIHCMNPAADHPMRFPRLPVKAGVRRPSRALIRRISRGKARFPAQRGSIRLSCCTHTGLKSYAS